MLVWEQVAASTADVVDKQETERVTPHMLVSGPMSVTLRQRQGYTPRFSGLCRSYLLLVELRN